MNARVASLPKACAPKRASVETAMADAIATVATGAGKVSVSALRGLGFTPEQIRRHGDDAMARAMVMHPTLMALALEGV